MGSIIEERSAVGKLRRRVAALYEWGMDELQVWTTGELGRVRLDRPRAINALTRAMIDGLGDALAHWADDPAVSALFLDGAGERGLCSGADVRAIREALLAGDPAGTDFLLAEFAVNRRISDWPKPYVAWMDGLVMGGGLGVSAHGSVRLATARARMAMPETIIGFFPDVGITWFLARAPHELGTHVALTGTTVTGADGVVLGLADALVDPAIKDDVVAALAAGRPVRAGDLGDTAPDAPLLADSSWIEECYAPTGATDPAGILAELRLIVRRLRDHRAPGAARAADTLAERNPVSVAVTLFAVRQAARLGSVAEVLERDAAIGPRLIAQRNFAEGVRAQLVDKDRAPRWVPAGIDDVTVAELAEIVG
jgi:enoyl-CoA hydratase